MVNKAREDSEFMKEISFKNGVGYIGNHEDPAEFSAMAPIEFEETLTNLVDIWKIG